VKTGEVGVLSAAGTRTNGQRRDGAASCALWNEEDGARKGEKRGEVEVRSAASHARIEGKWGRREGMRSGAG
jgi:hypothetical protein